MLALGWVFAQFVLKHELSNSQLKFQQSSGATSTSHTLAASAAASISPAESDCSGCSYSVRHKLHVRKYIYYM